MPDIDYESVNVPKTKPPEKYSYVERRKELLNLVREAGHPGALNQTQISQRYGVSQQQISQDFDRLAEYVSEHVGERRQLNAQAVFEKCVRELLDAGDWRGAAQAQAQYENFLDRHTDGESGGDDPSPFESEGMETEDYRLVEADDAE